MLDKEIIEKLNRPLDHSRIKTRQGGGGRDLAYLKGHNVIDMANEVFGYGQWGYDLLNVELVNVTGEEGEIVGGYYAARVRLNVAGCQSITEEGINPIQEGRNPRAKIDAHDMARKGAVTDAMKRALRCFGDQFGNSLYDSEPGGDGDTRKTPPPLLPAQGQRQQAPTQATSRPVTQNQPQTVNTTPAPLQAVKTVTPAAQPIPAPTKLLTTKPANHTCPVCDGPVVLFEGVGTKENPNEAYKGEKCTAKGCDYKKRIA